MPRKLPKATDSAELNVLGHVKKYGWSVLNIPSDDVGPGFSYSAGLYYSFKHPEVIVFGLSREVAQAFINEVGKRVKGGDFIKPKIAVDGIASNRPLSFVPFGKRYYKEFLGFANWLYQGTDYPALQMVWVDKAGRFPWDDKFDGAMFEIQPLLCEDRQECWPFTLAKNTAVFTHAAIFEKDAPIIHVSHDHEGDWQFLDGVSSNATRNAKLVALSVVARRDPSVLELADLKCGWRASREKPGASWKREAFPESDD